MKNIYLISIAVLMLGAGTVHAGAVIPSPVLVDLDNMFAQGNQVTARFADNDTDLIGCGVRVFDDGISQFSFGFCQATDSDEENIVCFTQNPNLLETMRANSDFAFITFNWQDDGFGGFECTRVGFSTQSFYIPDFELNDSDEDSDID